MAGAVAVGTVLPVAGDRAIDQGGVRLLQHVVSHAELVQDARAKALDQDVRGLDQLEERLPATLLLQIEADRSLVAVEGEVDRRAGAERVVLLVAVVGRRPAHVVALTGVLDLDHVGAEVGEQQGAETAGQQAGEVEDLDVREGPLAHAFASAFFVSPSSSRASSTVAARRPTSSVICRALAISSPFDFAISPLGR